MGYDADARPAYPRISRTRARKTREIETAPCEEANTLKVLLLLDRPPSPPIDGVRVKTHHLIAALRKRHEVSIVALRGSDDVIDERGLSDVTWIPKPAPASGWSKTLGHLFRPMASFATLLSDAAVDSQIGDVVARTRPDIVHVDTINLLGAASTVADQVPSFASVNDSLYLTYRDQARFLARVDPRRAAYRKAQAALLERTECRWYRNFDSVHVVSEVDASSLRERDPSLQIEMIPNGVDAAHFRPLGEEEEPRSMVFVADLRGISGEYAIHFVTSILPRVWVDHPTATMTIVGLGPPQGLRRLAAGEPRLRVTGLVDDYRPLVDKASVSLSLVPKQAGFMNKIAEAMAMSKCVVGYRSGFRSFGGAVDGTHFVGIDDDSDFATAITHVFRDEKKRRSIGAAARELVESDYGWTGVAARYEEAYERAIERWKQTRSSRRSG